VSDGLFDAMDNDLRLLTGCVDQQHHEIIATEPCHHIGVPADLQDPLSQGDQHVIARLTAVERVDTLEIIQVEIEQRHRCRLARAELEALLGKGEEAASVLQARESIPGGQKRDGHLLFDDPGQIPQDVDLLAIQGSGCLIGNAEGTDPAIVKPQGAAGIEADVGLALNKWIVVESVVSRASDTMNTSDPRMAWAQNETLLGVSDASRPAEDFGHCRCSSTRLTMSIGV
jgi:hypothetical protein